MRFTKEGFKQFQISLLQDEVNICVLPMYHIFAMNVTMSCMLYQGGKTITLPAFDPALFLETMLKYRPTNLQLAPPLVQFLAAHPAVTKEHLASLNNVTIVRLDQSKLICDSRLLLVQLLQVLPSLISS